MIFHYMGKFNGDPETLPNGAHHPGATIYREPDEKKLPIVANVGALILSLITMTAFVLRGLTSHGGNRGWQVLLGFALAMVALAPHEFLHALCFRRDVYMYTWLSKGMLFVFGPEPMTRARFTFMSLLPNLAFGFIPFILFVIHPEWVVLGALGALSIPSGFADYMNVFNCLTQVPRGGFTYMHGIHTYWYKP